jgi:hypothetical protein
VGTALFNGVQKTLVLGGYGVAAGGHDGQIPYSLMNVSKGGDTAFPSF